MIPVEINAAAIAVGCGDTILNFGFGMLLCGRGETRCHVESRPAETELAPASVGQDVNVDGNNNTHTDIKTRDRDCPRQIILFMLYD